MKIRLSKKSIISIHNTIIKYSGGDNGLLNSSPLDYAMNHIKYNNSSKEFYNNLAILVRAIGHDHPFLDGNKRTSLFILKSILLSNKLKLNLTQRQQKNFVLKIAKGNYNSLIKLSNYIKRNTK